MFNLSKKQMILIKLLYSKEVDSLMLKHIESFIFGCIELKQSKIKEHCEYGLKEHCKYELRNNLLVIKGGLCNE